MSIFNKKNIFIIISLLVGFFLFVIAFREVGIDELKRVFFVFPKEALFLFFVINFIAIGVISSLRWYEILKTQACEVSFWQVVQAKLAGFSLSYVTPAALVGGEPLRAYMVKESSNCSWEKSFASVILDQAIFFITLSVLILSGFFMLYEGFDLPMSITLPIFIFAILVLFSMYFLYRRTINRNEGEKTFFIFLLNKTRLSKLRFFKGKMKNIEKMDYMIESFFKMHKKTFILTFILSFVEMFFYVLLVYSICMFLGESIQFVNALEIFSLITIANLVPIPGALGSFELSLTFVFHLLGLGKENGLAFSLIFRFINVALCLTGLLFVFSFILKTVSNSFSLDAPPFILKLHNIFYKILKRK